MVIAAALAPAAALASEVAVRFGPTAPAPGFSLSKDLVPLVSLLSTTGIAVFSIWYQRRRDVLSRRFVPRVDYDLDCRFFGPQQGRYVAELSLKAVNKGEVRRVFESIEFRVLGMRRDVEPCYWGSGKLRAAFPKVLMKDDMMRSPEHKYYVEPGVGQLFSYTTLVPGVYSYVLVRAKVTRFSESDPLPHEPEDPRDRVFTVERVFEVKPTLSSGQAPGHRPVPSRPKRPRPPMRSARPRK